MNIQDIKEFEDKLRKMTVIEIGDIELHKELLKCYVLIGDLTGMIKKRYANIYDSGMEINKAKENVLKKGYVKAQLTKDGRKN